MMEPEWTLSSCVYFERHGTDSGGSSALWPGLPAKASQEGAHVLHRRAAAGIRHRLRKLRLKHRKVLPSDSLCVFVRLLTGDAEPVCSGQQPWRADVTEAGRNDGAEQESHTGREPWKDHHHVTKGITPSAPSGDWNHCKPQLENILDNTHKKKTPWFVGNVVTIDAMYCRTCFSNYDNTITYYIKH